MPAALGAVKVSIVFIEAGSWASASPRGSLPLPCRERHKNDAQHDRYDAHPFRRPVSAARFCAAGSQEHDRPRSREPENPSQDECRTVHTPVWCRQHQDDGDDRHRAQRDAHAERQDLADRLTHRLASYARPVKAPVVCEHAGPVALDADRRPAALRGSESALSAPAT
jgi:hypothetical protein